MLTITYPYFPIIFYEIRTKTMYPYLTVVFDHLKTSLIIKTQRELIKNILYRMIETHNIEHTPTTIDSTVTKPKNHHLSHRYNQYDQRILHHSQHTTLPKHNDYIIYLTNHSHLIYLSAISPHLYEFKIMTM